MLHFPFFSEYAPRTVTTLHGRLDLKDLDGPYRRWPEFPLVSISDHQRHPLPDASWHATIQHGLPIDLYLPPTRPTGDYLAFLGRISPEKRPDRAIEIARRSGLPLKIAAKVDRVDHTYFHGKIEPLLADHLVEYIGEIGDVDKAGFLGNAKALLFPIDWPEPFGLVMIEAMASGTPVIAWRCGSVTEVIEHESTGFIVESIDDAVAAVHRIDSIDRRLVRSIFEQRFTAEVMARNYLQLYWRLLGTRPDRPVLHLVS